MPGPVSAGTEPVEPQSLKKLSFKSLKRALDFFSPTHGQYPPPDPESKRVRMNYKLNTEYASVKSQSKNQSEEQGHGAQGQSGQPFPSLQLALAGPQNSHIEGGDKSTVNTASLQPKGLNDSILPSKSSANPVVPVGSERPQSTSALMERVSSRWPRPEWHAPWKCYRVLEGHMGWVRSVAVDPSNSWFCTGSADRTIKIWDLASGRLKLTLTGHIEQIRGLAVSTRHTYLFSAGDDKQVKCWDLEQNKVIRSYHGHLSGVYCLAMHPTLDLLLTGGRDSVCRVWDIRTKAMVFALSGHTNTVCSVFSRPTDPQVVTGSHDTTIKFWDLAAGKTMTTLTNHKKSVRALAPHPNEHCFASASADNIKKFKLPKGEFLHNMLSQQKTIINAASVNENGVLVTAGDNGRLWFWDWISGYNFHQAESLVQPGSLDCEAGIYALTYDLSGTRLITCEADKTVKMWKEDPDATPETHPIHFKPPKDLKRY